MQKNSSKHKIVFNIFFLGLVALASMAMAFSPVSFKQIAYALNNSYSKSLPASLTSTEWNNLAADFVWKEGDTMTGALNMGGNSITNLATPATTDLNHAANVDYVNNNLGSGGAQSPTGATVNVICGQSPPTTTDWVQESGRIYTDVDTTNGGISNFSGSPAGTPYYIISLGGSNHMYDSVTLSTKWPTVDGFRAYVTTGRSAFDAESNNWHINWCGTGN